MRKTRITTIGGGSGQYVLLSGLRDVRNIEIKSIVAMSDSGSSTGRLRDEMGILPPGDIMKCVLALSPEREQARRLLLRRFEGNKKLAGHSVGNMLLMVLSQYVDNFPDGVKALSEILDVRGEVLPVTIDRTTLAAELTDGTFLYGEETIDIPKGNTKRKIKRAFLVPHHGGSISAYPQAIKAIEQAHYIIIGPGDLYTSIASNLLVPGVKEAIERTKAKLVFVTNIMTKFGETDDFSAKDFIKNLERLVDRKIDAVIVNSTTPDKDLLHKYRENRSCLVENNISPDWGGRKIIHADLLSAGGDLARHDPVKLAKAVETVVKPAKDHTEIVILAAGQGKRMGSEIPKVLTPINGRPMIEYLVKSIKKSGVTKAPVIVVSGDNRERIKSKLDKFACRYAIQKEQLGTGHALACARKTIGEENSRVVCFYGDHPFFKPETIRKIANGRRGAVTIMTTAVRDFQGWRKNFYHWGRVVRENGRIREIVEFKDADDSIREIREVNPAIYCFDSAWLWENLDKLKNDNAQKEYYLTDLVKMAFRQGLPVESLPIDPQEAMGINTKEELGIAEKMVK